MCGRYRRKSDKQRIADAFDVTAGLEELDLGPDDDIAPGSIQPVVSINQDGERQLELMRWGFKLAVRLLFNARSEGIESSKFWKDALLKGRVIVPAAALFEWKEMPKGQKKPKYEIHAHRAGTLRHGRSLEEPENRSVGAHIRRHHRRAELNSWLPFMTHDHIS
jgi:putative SOS response-associated peptidase YedK